MTRHPAYSWTLLTLSIVLTGVSASEAGQFGRWYARNGYYYYPACPAAMATTPPAPTTPAAGQPTASTPGTPAAGQPMASTASPTVHTAMKPVMGENAGSAAVSTPQVRSYVPAAPVYPSSGWSVTPRSSWDYGSFPPYH